MMSGTLVNGSQSDLVSSADRGLSYGDGLFETIQISRGTPLLWDAHISRLSLGAKRLGIPFDISMQRAFLDDFTQLYQQCDGSLKKRAVLKLILTRGVGKRGYKIDPSAPATRITSLSAAPDLQVKQAQGIDMALCETRLAQQPLLAGIKHLNRLEQVLARSEWDDESISEGLLRDTQDNLIEGCMSNLFWVKQGVLFTPDLGNSGVAGVVRDTLIQLCDQQQITSIKQGFYPLDKLLSADEVFVCNSVFNILPVVRLTSPDNQDELASFSIGQYTKLLQELLKQHYLKEIEH